MGTFKTGNVRPNIFKRIFRAIARFKWGYLLFAVMFMAAGVVFIGYPQQATKTACIVVGAAAFLFSCIALIVSLSHKARGFRFWAQTVTAGLGIVTGLIVIILSAIGHGAGVFHVLVLILAAYMIIDGSFKLQTTILSRRYKSWFWWVLMVLVIIAIALGVIVLYNGSNMGDLIREEMEATEDNSHWVSRLVGFSFFVDGLMNLLSIIFLYKIEHGQKYEIIKELEEEGRIAVVEDGEPSAVEVTDAPVTLPAEGTDALPGVTVESLPATDDIDA